MAATAAAIRAAVLPHRRAVRRRLRRRRRAPRRAVLRAARRRHPHQLCVAIRAHPPRVRLRCWRIVVEDGALLSLSLSLSLFLRRGAHEAGEGALDRAVLMTGISHDGVVLVGPSGPHDPPSAACAKARQIGQRMRDLGCVVGALGSGLAMLAHLNDWLHTHRRAHDLGGDPRAQRDDHVWRLAPCPIRPPPCVTAPWSPPRRRGVRPCTRRRRCFAMPSSTTGSEQSRAGRHLGFH